jgi:hypothetical protein
VTQVADLQTRVADLEGTGVATQAPTLPEESMGPVFWKRTANVVASPGSLHKTTDSGNAWNSGAISVQELSFSTQPQGVTFKCNACYATAIGLGSAGGYGSDNPSEYGTMYKDIEFAVYCYDGGLMGIFESGTSIYAESGLQNPPYTSDDVIGVRVTGSIVEYLKNDQVFHTSTSVPTFPLHVDVAMHNQGDAVTEVTIY